VPGTASVYAERVTGGNYLTVRIDRDAAARFGIQVDDIQDVIASSIGGMDVGSTVEGLERYPINVRYPRELRESLEAIRSVLVHSPMGHHVPLGELADIRFERGAPVVKTEGARRTAWIFVDVSDSDIGGYVRRAQQALAEDVSLPEGYRLVWSGQFEYMQRAAARLRVILPVTLVIVFLLLYLNFGRLTEALLVMAVLPFALIGGVWLLYLLGYDLSVAVFVGFIALAGVAAETGVVMIIYIQHAVEAAHAESAGPLSGASLRAAIMEGAAERVRPKMMTVSAILFGLLPIMWATGTGASVMKRIAAPMIGGMLSATVMTLLVIPVVYGAILARRNRRESPTDLPADG